MNTIKYPIIVLEGPDGMGKTTWARTFIEAVGGRYLHLGLRKDLKAFQTMSLATAVEWARECPVVIDRHWPSEQLYGAAYRGGSPLWKEAQIFERVMDTLGVFYVAALLESSHHMLNIYRDIKMKRREMYECDLTYMWLTELHLEWWFGTSTSSREAFSFPDKDTNFCYHTRGFSVNRPDSTATYNRSKDSLIDHVDEVYARARNFLASKSESSEHQYLSQPQHLIQQFYP